MSVLQSPYQCVMCKKSFVYPKAFGKHMETCKKLKVKQSESESDTKNDNNNLLSGKVVQDQKFKQMKFPKNQERLYTTVKKSISNTTQIHSCKFCAKKFATIGNMKAHEKNHAGI